MNPILITTMTSKQSIRIGWLAVLFWAAALVSTRTIGHYFSLWFFAPMHPWQEMLLGLGIMASFAALVLIGVSIARQP